jgi:hypothetical protein
MTGDVTYTSGSFNGTANVTGNATLADSGVVAGTYNNNAAQVRPFTVDAKGRVTSVGTAVPIALDYSAITGSPYKDEVLIATIANLTATYNNGTSGVGATLQNSGTLGGLTIEGVSPGSGDRVLVKDQTTAFQNGIYTVTNPGSASVAWVLTRATDADTPAKLAGAVVTCQRGTTNGGRVFTTTFTAAGTIGSSGQNWWLVVTNGGSEIISESMIADSAVTTAKLANSTSTTTGVTNAKLRQSAGNSVIGRSLAVGGSPADIVATAPGSVLRMAGDSGSIGFGQVTNLGIANSAVSFEKLDLPSNFPIQVVQSVKQGTQQVSESGDVWEDIGDLSLTLTRRIASASGAVRVQAVINNSTNNSTYGVLFRVVRGSTAIGLADSAGDRIQATTVSHFPNTGVGMTSSVIDFVDNSPGSTSTVTYKIQARTWSTVEGWINRSNTDSNAANYARAISTLTLTELTP